MSDVKGVDVVLLRTPFRYVTSTVTLVPVSNTRTQRIAQPLGCTSVLGAHTRALGSSSQQH